MTYETDGRERLFTGHTGRLFILITLISVVLMLSYRILPPLLPTIIDDLGRTTFLVGIALSLLRLSRAVMEYPSGRFADQLTRSTVVLGGLVVGIVGVGTLSLSRRTSCSSLTSWSWGWHWACTCLRLARSYRTCFTRSGVARSVST